MLFKSGAITVNEYIWKGLYRWSQNSILITFLINHKIKTYKTIGGVEELLLKFFNYPFKKEEMFELLV